MPKAAVSKSNAKTLKRVRREASLLLTKINGDSKSGIRTKADAGPGRVSVKTAVNLIGAGRRCWKRSNGNWTVGS